MLFNRKERKTRHPYVGIAILSLAATGVVSIVSKGKKFLKDKTEAVTGMIKGVKE